jgi:cardiolipin synthase
MLSGLFVHHWISLHGLVTVVALATYLMASHSLRQRRHPSAAIAWFISLALIPYVALPLYLLIGNRKLARPPYTPSIRTPLSANQKSGQPAARIQILASTLGLPEPSSYDHFELHEDGSHALQSLISVMDRATSTLDLCTFVFGRDVVGQKISRHLIQSARKGVRVRLMIDGIGRYLGGHPDLRPLITAGVQVSMFASPLSAPFRGRTNLRNHRKMVIADAQSLWMGGRNLSAEYFEGDQAFIHEKSPWVDMSFVLCGAIARQAQEQFNKDWAFATQAGRIEAPTPSASVQLVFSSAAQLVPSGPDQAEDTVYTLLISSCFAAQSRILAVSPYFVPDATLQMALTLAARRGVSVDLLLPRKSNHRLADMARHAALRELSSAGARIWLVPGMIHAKAFVIDDEIALAGSANLDERSLFLNYELMVAFYALSEIQQFVQWIERQAEGAHAYKARRSGILREVGEGMVRWLAFQL